MIVTAKEGKRKTGCNNIGKMIRMMVKKVRKMMELYMVSMELKIKMEIMSNQRMLYQKIQARVAVKMTTITTQKQMA